MRREYNIRRVTVVLVLAAITGVVMAIAMFPSYVTVLQRKRSMQQELDRVTDSFDTERSRRLTAQLERTNTHLGVLEPYKNHVPLYVLIDNVLARVPDQVSISGINYERRTTEGENNGTQERVTLGVKGDAATRDSLIRFKESLKEASQFDEIELPVSFLASKSDIDFSLTVTSTF